MIEYTVKQRNDWYNMKVHSKLPGRQFAKVVIHSLGLDLPNKRLWGLKWIAAQNISWNRLQPIALYCATTYGGPINP